MKIDRCVSLVMLGLTLILMGGCQSDRSVAERISGSTIFGTRIKVPMGTQLDVRLGSSLSSKTASVGDLWTGTLAKPVVEQGREVLPAGCRVEGTVVSAEPAQRGTRARIELGVRAVRVEDRKISLRADADPVVAGSPRVRNIGAIAGGAAVGALLGKAIGGDAEDAAKGALVGGAVATGAVAASRGYQVELHHGTTMKFLVAREVAVLVD